MRLTRALSAILALSLAAPVTVHAAPVTTRFTIVSEGFETTPAASYTTAPLVVAPANGNRFWGRITQSKRSGSWGLYVAGAPTSSWPTYTKYSSGEARFSVPQLADYYAARLDFYYTMPSLGVADADAFSVHWKPTGSSLPSAISGLVKKSAWTAQGYELASDTGPISRQSGEIWFQWVDRVEGYNQTPQTAQGPTIDDVTISGWKYGPVRSVQVADVGHTTARLTWLKPYRAVGSSVEETRALVYDVWRQPVAGSTWTNVATGIPSTQFTDTGLTPLTGYTFAVQARDASLSGYGEHASVVATTTNIVPTAKPDAYTVAEDTTLTVAPTGVLANDVDGDGDVLTAIKVGNPANGTAVLAASGALTYTPSRDFFGSDSFTYRATDPYGASSMTTVTIIVTPVNDAPVATDDAGACSEDSTLTVAAPGLLSNDVDVEGSPLSVVGVTQPINGTVTAAVDGSYVYRPKKDFSGTDRFTYRVSDGTVQSQPATVTITVAPVNDAPIAADDSASLAEDTVLKVLAPGFLANDTDVEGSALVAQLVSAPKHGTMTVAPDGGYEYRPARDFAGADTFTYRAFDGELYSAPAVVRVTVSAVNDRPVAVDDYYGARLSTPLTVAAGEGVLAGDADVDGDRLQAVLMSGPIHGTVALAPDGSFAYEPGASFVQTDTFTYRAWDGAEYSDPATVLITAVDHAPLAAADDVGSTPEDTQMAIPASTLLANDSDLDGDALKVVIAAQPQHGAVSPGQSGGLVYTPVADYNGPDVFTYRAFDNASYSETVSVSLDVAPVNDAPVARPDAYWLDEDSMLAPSGGVAWNDVDVDSTVVSAVLISGPAHGTLVGGLDADGTFLYRPAQDYAGSDSFVYRLWDGEAYSAPVTVSLDVRPINDEPEANADAYSVDEDEALSVSAVDGVLGNDLDVDGDAMTAHLVTGPGRGTLSLSSDGAFEYVPAAGYSGSDSFVYRATDGMRSASATVTLTVARSAGIVSRIAGTDRFAVAEALARRGWDPAGDRSWPGVTDVIVANGENGKEADPLAAAGLAGAYEAPVLLVQAARIPTQTRRALAEIAGKNPGVRVHVIGGTATVPAARWAEIKAIPGVSAQDLRIAGRDRYDVTALIARRMVEKLGAAGVSGALIVNAEHSAAFYDALAASPQAYAGRWAMLAVRSGSVPAPVASVLSGPLAGKPRHVVNATGFVNSTVYAQTKASQRYSATTEFYTSATQIAGKAVAVGANSVATMGLAAKLPDALTGGVFLGRQGGVLLFTDSSSALRPVTRDYISVRSGDIAQGWILGGTASVPVGQETAFGALIR